MPILRSRWIRRLAALFPWRRRAWGWYRDLKRSIPVQKLPGRRFRCEGRPSGFYSTLEELAAEEPGVIETREIFPAEEIHLTLPEGLPPHVAADWSRYCHYRTPPACIHTLRDCRFWGYYGGVWISPKNRLILPLSPDRWGPDRHQALCQTAFPPCSRIPQPVAVASTPEADCNYYHWLIELIPKLICLKNSPLVFDQVGYWLINYKQTRYQTDYLDLLGIPLAKILSTNVNSHFHCSEAYLVHALPATPCVSRWQLNCISGLGEFPSVANGKIFVERLNKEMRRIVNNKDIVELMTGFGFTIHRLHEISVPRQLHLFRSSMYIAGSHGAGLANIVFCAPNSAVLELHSDVACKPHYFILSSLSNIKYQASFGTRANASPSGDFRIDPSIIAGAIKNIR